MTVFLCGSSWGIGSYTHTTSDGDVIHGYGLFYPENPHDFTPDVDCCTPEEIENHRKACEDWDKK